MTHHGGTKRGNAKAEHAFLLRCEGKKLAGSASHGKQPG
jgi:hypothetical protein